MFVFDRVDRAVCQGATRRSRDTGDQLGRGGIFNDLVWCLVPRCVCNPGRHVPPAGTCRTCRPVTAGTRHSGRAGTRHPGRAGRHRRQVDSHIVTCRVAQKRVTNGSRSLATPRRQMFELLGAQFTFKRRCLMIKELCILYLIQLSTTLKHTRYPYCVSY